MSQCFWDCKINYNNSLSNDIFSPPFQNSKGWERSYHVTNILVSLWLVILSNFDVYQVLVLGCTWYKCSMRQLVGLLNFLPSYIRSRMKVTVLVLQCCFIIVRDLHRLWWEEDNEDESETESESKIQIGCNEQNEKLKHFKSNFFISIVDLTMMGGR